MRIVNVTFAELRAIHRLVRECEIYFPSSHPVDPRRYTKLELSGYFDEVHWFEGVLAIVPELAAEVRPRHEAFMRGEAVGPPENFHLKAWYVIPAGLPRIREATSEEEDRATPTASVE